MTTVYDVLRQPVQTEKSSYLSRKLHQYVFRVARDATKAQIKDAVEALFDVNVLRVNVLVAPPKRGRRWRRTTIRRSAYKKAIVTIAADQTIDVFEGVK